LSLRGEVRSLGQRAILPLLQQLAEVICLTVMMYVRYPLLLRQVEDTVRIEGSISVTRRKWSPPQPTACSQHLDQPSAPLLTPVENHLGDVRRRQM
jgi:hypothetical protein